MATHSGTAPSSAVYLAVLSLPVGFSGAALTAGLTECTELDALHAAAFMLLALCTGLCAWSAAHALWSSASAWALASTLFSHTPPSSGSSSLSTSRMQDRAVTAHTNAVLALKEESMLARNVLLLVIALVLALAPVAQAQDGSTTLTSRVDTSVGTSPVYASSILRPEVEIWVFGLPHAPDIEVGRLFTVGTVAGHTVRAGGYVAYVVDPKRVDLLPWVNVKGKVLGGAYGLNLAGRVPLDGSSLTAFSDDSSILWGSGPLKAGISGTFKVTEGQTLTGGIGPKLSYSITPRLTVSSRYVIKNRGENVLRFAFATTF